MFISAAETGSAGDEATATLHFALADQSLLQVGYLASSTHHSSWLLALSASHTAERVAKAFNITVSKEPHRRAATHLPARLLLSVLMISSQKQHKPPDANVQCSMRYPRCPIPGRGITSCPVVAQVLK